MEEISAIATLVHVGRSFLNVCHSKTRMELPSCEAIDVKKVSIGNIVLPGNKFKAGTNLGLLPT